MIRETIFLSDVHLAGGLHNDHLQNEALAAFLEQLGQDAAGEQTQLVLLGDVFDILAARAHLDAPFCGILDEVSALMALDIILTRHSRVLCALSQLMTSGVPIHIVLGNHDIDLVRPAVQERLFQRLGSLSDGARPVGRLVVHPWVYWRPGLVYAEHGHQHHDINSYASPLHPFRGQSDRLDASPAAWRDLRLSRVRRELLTLQSIWRRLGNQEQSLAELGSMSMSRSMSMSIPQPTSSVTTSNRSKSSTPYQVAPCEEALPAEVLRELANQTAKPNWATVRRIVSGMASTKKHQETNSGSYLLDAATQVNGALHRFDCAVPLYVFGHNHIGEVRSSPGRPVYANTGTWSAYLPRPFEDIQDGRRCTFIRLTERLSEGVAEVNLCRWDPATSTSEIVGPTTIVLTGIKTAATYPREFRAPGSLGVSNTTTGASLSDRATVRH